MDDNFLNTSIAILKPITVLCSVNQTLQMKNYIQLQKDDAIPGKVQKLRRQHGISTRPWDQSR